MTGSEQAARFLTRHDMHYEQMPFGELTARYGEEMDMGLAGKPSTLYMLPTYLRASDRPEIEKSVLVIDAGGTNLRVARMHFSPEGRPLTDELIKCRMPGADGETTVDGMFEFIAAQALRVCQDSECACISFSYPCEILPNGDGRILRLCKELHVQGAEGALVCERLEAALRALGAPGSRRWRLINDTVGAMLGGMAEADRSRYADYIGFILGTGTNACCNIDTARITKSPEAVAMGGDMIVNLETGCFGRLLLGSVDREIDEESDIPGDHLAEKMISGAYYPEILRRTLRLACREGYLSPAAEKKLADTRVTSRDVDLFCLAPAGDNLLASLCDTDDERAFASTVNDMLLERAARITAASLTAILQRREGLRGKTICVCADGTTFNKNPVLKPKTEAILRNSVAEKLGITVEFIAVSDATLLGSAYAGLI